MPLAIASATAGTRGGGTWPPPKPSITIAAGRRATASASWDPPAPVTMRTISTSIASRDAGSPR
jgi:hypothetical protein